MKVPMTEHQDPNGPQGFYAVDLETFLQTLGECHVALTTDMGNGVVIHYGTRGRHPVWLLENPGGSYGVWVEDAHG